MSRRRSLPPRESRALAPARTARRTRPPGRVRRQAACRPATGTSRSRPAETRTAARRPPRAANRPRSAAAYRPGQARATSPGSRTTRWSAGTGARCPPWRSPRSHTKPARSERRRALWRSRAAGRRAPTACSGPARQRSRGRTCPAPPGLSAAAENQARRRRPGDIRAAPPRWPAREPQRSRRSGTPRSPGQRRRPSRAADIRTRR